MFFVVVINYFYSLLSFYGKSFKQDYYVNSVLFFVCIEGEDIGLENYTGTTFYKHVSSFVGLKVSTQFVPTILSKI